MNAQNAIDALTLQHRRLTDMLRGIDGGLWWSSDVTAGIDADSIYAQAEVIRIALDETKRLVTKITA
ncbi:hypothetical protein [Methylobacterium marchantiae]|uniref:Uncharacterized protein n=1 Tax=Methylobacterium marchantiae TaxID=600331 RepID=A0ABW3X0H6_9HYPH|nr:hypothetical protein AIGOOFII_2237 [Methylobacterium marchantiae]